MADIYNVYCDESCHLENDGHSDMILGALWCPQDKRREISQKIREIKVKHNLSANMEIKWTKVSPGKSLFYEDVVNYFFDDNDINFRVLVAKNKSKLRHRDFGQDHDTWYFKMYFNLLKVMLDPRAKYYIYLDIKDTHSEKKLFDLKKILSNNLYDFSHSIIQRLQAVRSHEVEQIQLADLLIGAVGAANRSRTISPTKKALIELIKKRSGYHLTQTTLFKEEKFNIFIWEPDKKDDCRNG